MWKMKSTRYWSVSMSQEAFHDLYYVFMVGRVAANMITIYDVEKYNRFSHKWESETDLVQSFIDEHKDIYKCAENKKKKIILSKC